jgi:serine/threonine protein kinase
MTTTTGHTEPEVGGGLLPPPPPQTMMNSIFRGEMPDDVTQKYELLNVLGAGTFGIVRKCRHKESGEVFAVKTIQKSKVPDLNILKREIEILQEVDHPHIVKLYDVYENEKVRGEKIETYERSAESSPLQQVITVAA